MGKNIDMEQYLRELTKTFKPLAEPLAINVIPSSLEDLRNKLRRAFDSSIVDLELVNHLLLTYKANPDDFKAYINFDDNVYTRNLVDTGNGKYNLIILCWNKGQQSSIHDHADSNCFMKMLQGELIEVRFEMTPDDTRNCKLTEVATKSLYLNDVAYINDNIGLHQVKNPSKTVGAISLHLYCPAFKFCKVYEKTGECKIAEMKFHSMYGKPTINEN